MINISNKNIINFLKENYQSTGFIDGLKIKYRSLICPFVELLDYVTPNASVADVGCGSGQFLLLVSEFAQPSQVFGIEVSERLIKNANNLFSKYERQQAYEFQVFDGITFPKELERIDIIYLIDVLHHVPKDLQEQFLEKLISLLKPGAKLILKDIDASNPLVIFNKIHDFIFANEIGNEMKSSKVRYLLEKNNLKIIESFKKTMYVYPHFLFIAQKPID